MLVLLRLANLLLIIGLIVGLTMVFIWIVRAQMEIWRGKRKQTYDLSQPSAEGVRDLVAQGQTDEALDLYQRFAGVDEFTAREAIAEMERELRLADDMQPAVRRVLRDEGKAAAIEAYQQATGAPLADALDYVEKIERRR